MIQQHYVKDIYNYQRRASDPVKIGTLYVGGSYPIALQSMTNTSTLDTDSSIKQIIRIEEEGAHLVRLTAQGVREASNLKFIKQQLEAQKIHIPLSADIHFNPKAAFEAALHVEKVRINPGNFMDLTQEGKLETIFVPFLQLCKEQQTAIRIGVNHGSLSERILLKYGDTPLGMVESCMEFLRICKREHFEHVVISMKASNTLVMVQSVRLLIATMLNEDMHYPLHLGVTEAGDGEDGRIKSAVGIGALLADGIGDTIRVSLSEEPEFEIPVAKQLVDHTHSFVHQAPLNIPSSPLFNPFQLSRRVTKQVGNIGNKQVPVIVAKASCTHWTDNTLTAPDFIYCGKHPLENPSSIPQILHYTVFRCDENTYPVFDVSSMDRAHSFDLSCQFIHLHLEEINNQVIDQLRQGNWVVILHATHIYPVGEVRAAVRLLYELQIPIIVGIHYNDTSLEKFQVKSASDLGVLLIDGLIDGLFVINNQIDLKEVVSTQFSILQAARARTSKTEYISCPGCGRTLFALQDVIAQIKAATSHLVGLKIGIMGCIVNGPGEMADADYGYVGAAPHKISIYKGQECIEKNIPQTEAVSKLIDLIKSSGDWVEPA